MSSIGGMLGLGGGASGTGFAGPQLAQVQQGVSPDQISSAYDQNQDALRQQQGLLNALGGLGGFGKQEGTYNELGGVAGQLQGIASGQGPNPAQAMLNQQTGANVANQAALMAGQRGAGGNVGLMARQASQQGGALQQQAVGQGATMQANQSLGALGQMGNVIGQRAGMANQMVANQIGATNALTGAQQAEQGQLLNALGNQNNANVSNQAGVNQANAGMARTGMQGQQGLIGGLLNVGAAAAAAKGGVIGYAGGGAIAPQSSLFSNMVSAPTQMSMPADDFSEANPGADKLKSALSGLGPKPSAAPPGAVSEGFLPQAQATPGAMYPGQAHGGKVDVMVSPGEKIVPPGEMDGEEVPGKAKTEGDNYENDVVHMKLEPGTIVVPRTKAKNDRSSADFVRKNLARRGKK